MLLSFGMANANRKGLYVIKSIVNKKNLGVKKARAAAEAKVDTVNYESKWVIVWDWASTMEWYSSVNIGYILFYMFMYSVNVGVFSDRDGLICFMWNIRGQEIFPLLVDPSYIFSFYVIRSFLSHFSLTLIWPSIFQILTC